MEAQGQQMQQEEPQQGQEELQQIEQQEQTINTLSSQVISCKQEKDTIIRELSVLFQQQQSQLSTLEEEKCRLQHELNETRLQSVDLCNNESLVEELSFELSSLKEENQHMKSLLI